MIAYTPADILKIGRMGMSKKTFGFYGSDDPYHEVCDCAACHEAGCHEDEKEAWAQRIIKRHGTGFITVRYGCEECRNTVYTEKDSHDC